MQSVNDGRQEVGQVLADLMRAERMSGRKLAALSGLSHSVPSHVLKGSRRPDPATLMRLARGLATDPYTKEIDQDKLLEYAGRLLRPLNLAPVLAGENEVTDYTARIKLVEE